MAQFPSNHEEMNPCKATNTSDQEELNDAQIQELIDAQTMVYYYASSIAGPMAIKCAIELHIPDAVARLHAQSNHSSAVTLSALAANLPLLHPSKVRFLPRIMRVLVQLGVFAAAPTSSEESEPGYLPTPLSSLLTSKPANRNNPNRSMVDYFRITCSPGAILHWFELGKWLQVGESGPATAYQSTHGMTVWELFREKPEIGVRFNNSLSSESGLLMELLVRHCADVFHGVASVVDVGGGTGAAARVIKKTFPRISCTVLELPNVVSVAQAEGYDGGGVEFVAGNMFENIPPADAVFLKCVLHDWDDENCVQLLKRCKEAIAPSKGKVFLLDILVGSNKTGDRMLLESQLFCDLNMMTTFASTERGEGEWREIFMGAGFSKFEVKKTLGLRSLMVAYS